MLGMPDIPPPPHPLCGTVSINHQDHGCMRNFGKGGGAKLEYFKTKKERWAHWKTMFKKGEIDTSR